MASDYSNEEASKHSVAQAVELGNPSPGSTSSQLGLLFLPAELRVEIFRHLLRHDRCISTSWLSTPLEPNPAILNTCKLIRQEALEVMYGENTFSVSWLHPEYSMLSNPLIKDTIQNVYCQVPFSNLPFRARIGLINTLREFGSPETIRGTLSVVFNVNDPESNHLLPPLIRAMRRFANFRTVRIQILDVWDQVLEDRFFLQFSGLIKDILEPVFGPAENLDDKSGLVFRPRQHLTSPPPEVDWKDHLDGIGLD